MIKALLMGVGSLLIVGCTTTGTFRVPPDTQLYVYERAQPETISSSGTVTSKPFFWTAAGVPPGGGIPYRLEKNGKTVKEGKLRANVRVVSFFWPPLAVIYWPIGYNPNITYDLVKGTQE